MMESVSKITSGLKQSSSKKDNRKTVFFQDTTEKINTCCFLKNPLPLLYYLFAGKTVDQVRKEKEKAVGAKESEMAVRAMSQEKRRILVERAEWKLQELKKLYKDSWNIYKLKSRQSVDNKSTTKLLRLLSKVRLKIMRTQGKIGLLEKCELLDMIENLDELNEEISTIKDDYYKMGALKNLEGLDSMYTMYNESLFMEPSQCLSYNIDDTSLLSDDWNSVTTSENYPSDLNNRDPTFTTEDLSKTCDYKLDESIMKPDKELATMNYLDKFEAVSDDIVKIRNEIYKFVNSDLKRKRRRMMMRKGHSSQMLCNEGSQKYEHSQRVDSVHRSHSEYERQLHRLIKRLEEIKIAYILLKNLPLKEGLKKYKRAEISRLMRDLRVINKDAATIKNKLDENERTGMCGEKSRRQERGEAGTAPKQNEKDAKEVVRPDHTSIRSNGLGTSEMMRDLIPWDRGTNSLYQTLMYNQIKHFKNLEESLSTMRKFREEVHDKSVNCELVGSRRMKSFFSRGDPTDGLVVKKINLKVPSKNSMKKSSFSLEIRGKNPEVMKSIEEKKNQEQNNLVSRMSLMRGKMEGEMEQKAKTKNNLAKLEKKNAGTSYDSMMTKQEMSVEGIPYWRSKFKELECDPFVKEAIESVVKGRNNAYSRAVMDMINKLGTKGMKFKIKCYNRGTSMTGIAEGSITRNVKCVVPETWYKYFQVDSKEKELLHESKKTASIQTEEKNTPANNKKGHSELYCFSKLSVRSFTLQNKALRKSVWKRRPRHVQYPGLLCYRYKTAKRPKKQNKTKQAGSNANKDSPHPSSCVSNNRGKNTTRQSSKTNFTTTTFVNSDKWLLNLLS